MADARRCPPLFHRIRAAKRCFRLAHDAYSELYYDTAIFYYQTILERYPDDRPAAIAAQYELAFIEYKIGNSDDALRQFNALLDEYRRDSIDYPYWVYSLAGKKCAEIALTLSDNPDSPEGACATAQSDILE